MGMTVQKMKRTPFGTTITPNGRTFNTNPAANQMMADRARMAREQRMQPSPQGGGYGGSNPNPMYPSRPQQSPVGMTQTGPQQGMGSFPNQQYAPVNIQAAQSTTPNPYLTAQQSADWQANLNRLNSSQQGPQAPQTMSGIGALQGPAAAAMQTQALAAMQAQQGMPPSPQALLPTTGTMTAPNGRVFNTNPAANQMMAQMAAAAKANPQQLAQGLQQQALIQNQMPRG